MNVIIMIDNLIWIAILFAVLICLFDPFSKNKYTKKEKDFIEHVENTVLDNYVKIISNLMKESNRRYYRIHYVCRIVTYSNKKFNYILVDIEVHDKSFTGHLYISGKLNFTRDKKYSDDFKNISRDEIQIALKEIGVLWIWLKEYKATQCRGFFVY